MDFHETCLKDGTRGVQINHLIVADPELNIIFMWRWRWMGAPGCVEH